MSYEVHVYKAGAYRPFAVGFRSKVDAEAYRARLARLNPDRQFQVQAKPVAWRYTCGR